MRSQRMKGPFSLHVRQRSRLHGERLRLQHRTVTSSPTRASRQPTRAATSSRESTASAPAVQPGDIRNQPTLRPDSPAPAPAPAFDRGRAADPRPGREVDRISDDYTST